MYRDQTVTHVMVRQLHVPVSTVCEYSEKHMLVAFLLFAMHHVQKTRDEDGFVFTRVQETTVENAEA